MIPCPIPNCGYRNDIDANVCAKCGEDLSSFSKLYFLPAYYYNQGLKAAQNREFDEAIKNLQLSASLDPSDIDTIILLGKVSAIKGDYKSAMEYWQQVLGVSPNNSEANRCIEKAVKILNETPQIAEKPLEPSDLSSMVKGLSFQLNELQKLQEKQNGQLKEIVGQIQGKEEVDKIISVLEKSQDFQGQQNQRLTKVERWLKIGSFIAIAACVVIALSTILFWKNLKDQSHRITEIQGIQKEQISSTAHSFKELSDQLKIMSAKAEELSEKTAQKYLTIQQGLKETSAKAGTLDKQLHNLQRQVKELSINLSNLQKQISEIKIYQQTPSTEEQGKPTK